MLGGGVGGMTAAHELVERGFEVDVYEMKRRFGDRLTFHGGVGIQELLPHGTPQEVKAEVRRLVREIGAGGGYILGPSHAILTDTPMQNLMALIEAVQEQ